MVSHLAIHNVKIQVTQLPVSVLPNFYPKTWITSLYVYCAWIKIAKQLTRLLEK